MSLKDILNSSTIDIQNPIKIIIKTKSIHFCSFIFTKVMAEIEPFYRTHDLHPTATGYFPLTSPCTSVCISFECQQIHKRKKTAHFNQSLFHFFFRIRMTQKTFRI